MKMQRGKEGKSRHVILNSVDEKKELPQRRMEKTYDMASKHKKWQGEKIADCLGNFEALFFDDSYAIFFCLFQATSKKEVSNVPDEIAVQPLIISDYLFLLKGK